MTHLLYLIKRWVSSYAARAKVEAKGGCDGKTKVSKEVKN